MQSVINCGVAVFAALVIVCTATYAFISLTEGEYDYPGGYFCGILSVGLAYVIYMIATTLPH